MKLPVGFFSLALGHLLKLANDFDFASWKYFRILMLVQFSLTNLKLFDWMPELMIKLTLINFVHKYDIILGTKLTAF